MDLLIRRCFNGTFDLADGQSFITTAPMKVTMRAWRIVDIQGSSEAGPFKSWRASYGDPNMCIIAGTGFGYDRLGGPPPKPASTGDYGS
ncbi:MAG: hypothetical protein M5U01_15340 [Ardenticatenaceae bacterium]|nr:hypothetical protein [Ardenticatenaceae bacterium]